MTLALAMCIIAGLICATVASCFVLWLRFKVETKVAGDSDVEERLLKIENAFKQESLSRMVNRG